MNISEKAKNIIDNCRFCWMCRHVCPIGNATGQERNTAHARALACSLALRGAQPLQEIVDNVYECSLCGACTNNCVTGFDPKVFIQEVKTACALGGVLPPYVQSMLQKYMDCGNVYGVRLSKALRAVTDGEKTDTLLLMGQDALYKSPQSVLNSAKVLQKANIPFTIEERASDTGAALWYLLGKAEETRQAALRCAEVMNGYKTVVVYDPVDLRLIRHEYKEWGIDVRANVVSFNTYLLNVIESGALKVTRGKTEYTLQDNYAYARDLDDCESGRKLIEHAGVVKDMLLVGKEADLAGNLMMNEYMPEAMAQVAACRIEQARRMDCKTLVTENPAEYELLKANCPKWLRVLSVEEMLLENMR